MKIIKGNINKYKIEFNKSIVFVDIEWYNFYINNKNADQKIFSCFVFLKSIMIVRFIK